MFSVVCSGVRVLGTLHLMFSLIIFFLYSVWVAGRQPFGRELLTRLTVCSLYILVISRFGFEGGIWILIPSIPGPCIFV